MHKLDSSVARMCIAQSDGMNCGNAARHTSRQYPQGWGIPYNAAGYDHTSLRT